MNFIERKQDILEALNKVPHEGTLGLVNGFRNTPVLDHLTDFLVCGGKRVPMVMAIDENTALVHLFSVKVLLSEEE